MSRGSCTLSVGLISHPQNPPPTLQVDGTSRHAKELWPRLKKAPADRLSASELLKHKFVKSAKKGLDSMAASFKSG